jgi:hypothetical protein
MDRAAKEMAFTLVNNNQKSLPAQVFPTNLIVRDSTFLRPSR